MKTTVTIILSIMAVFLFTASALAGSCTTNYPIVFVSGNGFDPTPQTPHQWGGILEQLERCGAAVTYINWDNKLADIATKTAQLKEEIEGKYDDQGDLIENGILQAFDTTHVNLFAHSQGGLVCRQYVSSEGGHNYVKSLTLVDVPNRGMEIARFVESVSWFPLQIANAMFCLEGTAVEGGLKGYFEMTPENITNNFNPANPDHPDVYYQSFSGAMNPNFLFPLDALRACMYAMWNLGDPAQVTFGIFEGILHDTNPLIHWFLMGGPNDGTVSVRSAKWGNYLGTQRGPWFFVWLTHGITHLDITDCSTNSQWDAPAYYQKVVEEELVRRNF